MTLNELSNFQSLDALIRATMDRILALEEQLTGGSRTFDGTPRKPGVRDKIGDTVPELVDEKAKLERMVRQYADERQRILDYIDGVEDYHILLILTLRFVESKTWKEVAAIMGGRNTEGSVKRACCRFFERERQP